MAITLLDSNGRTLLIMWAFSFTGSGTGWKPARAPAAIIWSRSMPRHAASCLRNVEMNPGGDFQLWANRRLQLGRSPTTSCAPLPSG